MRQCFKLCPFLLFFILALSCSEVDVETLQNPQGKENNAKNAFGFGLRTVTGQVVFPFLVTDSIIHITVPDSTLAHLTLVPKNREIMLGEEKYIGQEVDFSDFLHPHNISIIDNHEIHSWKIFVYNLPVLIVNTLSGQDITSKDQRIESNLISYYPDGKIDTLGKGGIRGRGNSTWLKPKKPYNIKLEKKHAVLGMDKSKNWILLSNPFYDRTQLHNATALEISRITEMPWTPSGRFVELILNNKHKGLFFLCEKIGVEKNKINIRELQATDTIGVELTGGYLLESYTKLLADSSDIVVDDSFIQTDFLKETGFQWARCNLFWEIKDPDNIHPLQKQYAINALNKLESLLFNQDSLKMGSYRRYLDIDSAIDWFLVEELCANMEAGKTKNMYIFKDVDDESALGGGRFCIGPPWDFDAYSFGTFQRSHSFLIKNNAFYYPILFKDPVFVNRVKERWNKYKSRWREDIPNFIERKYLAIRKSALRNEAMWDDWLPNDNYSNFDESVRYMVSWFIEHVEWLDAQISSM